MTERVVLSDQYDEALVLYLNKLRDVGEELTTEKRSFVLSMLEGLVSYTNGCQSFRGQGGEAVEVKFNGMIAKQLRERTGLNQIGLGRLLGYKSPAGGGVVVCQYETGIITLNPESKAHRRYLLWLKAQGYNPFGL